MQLQWSLLAARQPPTVPAFAASQRFFGCLTACERPHSLVQVDLEQLLSVLPVHLLAVLLGRQLHGGTSAEPNSGGAAVKAEPGAAATEPEPDSDAADGGMARDGPLELPAMYLKKGLVTLSHLADLAMRTPLASRLEVRPVLASSQLSNEHALRQCLKRCLAQCCCLTVSVPRVQSRYMRGFLARCAHQGAVRKCQVVPSSPACVPLDGQARGFHEQVVDLVAMTLVAIAGPDAPGCIECACLVFPSLSALPLCMVMAAANTVLYDCMVRLHVSQAAAARLASPATLAGCLTLAFRQCGRAVENNGVEGAAQALAKCALVPAAVSLLVYALQPPAAVAEPQVCHTMPGSAGRMQKDAARICSHGLLHLAQGTVAPEAQRLCRYSPIAASRRRFWVRRWFASACSARRAPSGCWTPSLTPSARSCAWCVHFASDRCLCSVTQQQSFDSEASTPLSSSELARLYFLSREHGAKLCRMASLEEADCALACALTTRSLWWFRIYK